jgi:hypothetical protein
LGYVLEDGSAIREERFNCASRHLICVEPDGFVIADGVDTLFCCINGEGWRRSMKRLCGVLLLVAVPILAEPLPARGLHVSAPLPGEIAVAEKFIREVLPKEGVNVLVVEFNYRYQFTKRPEVADNDALSRDDVKRLVEACRAAKVKLIPQINMLGHQSCSTKTAALLRAHPEFDETPGSYPDNKGIYCRSYCPLHPQVHEIVFDLMDELAEACEADAFHVGMDEVFLLGEDQCPRCRGRNKADLFAGEVRALRDHLAKCNRTLWMWGDRFLDTPTTGMGKWEAAENGTAPALQNVPRDIVIADWHYETAHPTAPYFALQGFRVVSSPWRKASVALRQLDMIRLARMNASSAVAERMLGVLHTTWCGFGAFARTYMGEQTDSVPALESVATFKQLFAELRKQP